MADGKLVGVEGRGDDVPDITSLTGDPRGEKSLANMAIDTIDAGMRRS